MVPMGLFFGLFAPVPFWLSKFKRLFRPRSPPYMIIHLSPPVHHLTAPCHTLQSKLLTNSALSLEIHPQAPLAAPEQDQHDDHLQLARLAVRRHQLDPAGLLHLGLRGPVGAALPPGALREVAPDRRRRHRRRLLPHRLHPDLCRRRRHRSVPSLPGMSWEIPLLLS